MNENFTSEMSFTEQAQMFIGEVEARTKAINDNNGETSNEMHLLISAMNCVKNGLCEIDNLKSDSDRLRDMLNEQLSLNHENKRQNEIIIKTLCEFICRNI